MDEGLVPVTHHMLTHLPALPTCEACRRGKSRDVQHFSKRFKREIVEFGDIITFDHLTMNKEVCIDDANTGATCKALVVKDIFTGFIDCIPVGTESAA